MKSKSTFSTASEQYVAPECQIVRLCQEAAFMTGSGASSDDWIIDGGDFPFGVAAIPDFIF